MTGGGIMHGPPGFTGTTGATGATGATGSTGSSGSAGATGPEGVPGSIGIPGRVGGTGYTGGTGSTGFTGKFGPSGKTGATGVIGPVGSTGSTGPPSIRKRRRIVAGTVDIERNFEVNENHANNVLIRKIRSLEDEVYAVTNGYNNFNHDINQHQTLQFIGCTSNCVMNFSIALRTEIDSLRSRLEFDMNLVQSLSQTKDKVSELFVHLKNQYEAAANGSFIDGNSAPMFWFILFIYYTSEAPCLIDLKYHPMANLAFSILRFGVFKYQNSSHMENN